MITAASSGCLICERIAQIEKRTNRHFVAELETGYVVLGDHQFFQGYTLLLGKWHVAELHDLDDGVRERFLIEMSLVAESVFRCFRPRKLNYECLGNAEPHLHWHLFPRHESDPSPRTPVWKVDQAIRRDAAHRPSDSELDLMRCELLEELTRRDGLVILREFAPA